MKHKKQPKLKKSSDITSCEPMKLKKAVVYVIPLELVGKILPLKKNIVKEMNISEELEEVNMMEKNFTSNVPTEAIKAAKPTETRKQISKKIKTLNETETLSDGIVSDDIVAGFLQATKGVMKSMNDSIEKCRDYEDDMECTPSFDLVSRLVAMRGLHMQNYT